MKKRFISWNVNGVRAVLKKNFLEFFQAVDADIFAVQESKCQAGQLKLDLPGYYQYWNYAGKKGYSGTAIFSREKPLAFSFGLNVPNASTYLEGGSPTDPAGNTFLSEMTEQEQIFTYSNEFIDAHIAETDEKFITRQMESEGRVITLEFDNYYFVTVYTPNSQNELKRLDARQVWNESFRQYLLALDALKPVIVCGDFNVAHKEIDLKNPETNHENAGFSDAERNDFSKLLDSGFTDSFRYFLPDATDRYSWWSYRTRARDRNAGWRIDYFLLSDRYMSEVISSEILDQVQGSDHCPIILEIKA